MMDAAPDLSLLVPCFNEDGRVDRCLDAARTWADARPDLAVEIVCVDDGSTDDTHERLDAWSRRWAAVRVVALAENRGKGGALKAGMAAARGAAVLFLDADLAVDLTHVDRALELIRDGADVVVGCRNVSGAAIRRKQRWPRRWLGKGYLKLARLLLRLRVADVTCGFKAFRRAVGQALFAQAACRRWGFDAEVLHLAQKAGCVLREMPVQWYDGEVSAVKLHRDVFGALRELVAVRARHAFRAAPHIAPSTTPAPRAHGVATGSLRDG